MRSISKCIQLLAICILFNANPSSAQDSGYYAKAFGGLSALQGNDFSFGGTTSGVSYDTGATFGAAIGYDYANSPFRAELEFAYRTGDAKDFATSFATGGDFASTTFMLNGYYLFETGSKLKPYAGLGIGYVTEIDFDIERGTGAGEYSDRGLLAYQVMVGAEYPLSPRLSAYGEARYFATEDATLSGSGGTELDAGYDTLDLNVGIAFRF